MLVLEGIDFGNSWGTILEFKCGDRNILEKSYCKMAKFSEIFNITTRKKVEMSILSGVHFGIAERGQFQIRFRRKNQSSFVILIPHLYQRLESNSNCWTKKRQSEKNHPINAQSNKCYYCVNIEHEELIQMGSLNFHQTLIHIQANIQIFARIRLNSVHMVTRNMYGYLNKCEWIIPHAWSHSY